MSKKKFNEDTLSEQPAIGQLKRLGYSHLHGDRLDPELNEDCERRSRRDVVLVDRLKRKLAEINPHLTEDTMKKAIRRITHIQGESNLEANQNFHRDLIAGISIDQDIRAQRRRVTVNFIDFNDIEKNEFLVVNQFWVRRHKTQARPDIVIFVNGIPLVVIECKSPVARSAGLEKAQHQLIRYQKEVPKLFRTNEILIGCNLFGAKYGTIGDSTGHYHEWKESGDVSRPDMADHSTIKELLRMGLIDREDLSPHPPMQEVLIAAILKKKNLLDIIRNFIVFDYSPEEHRVVKKICRYQQFSAVNKIIRRVTREDHKKGIIWHWQGSGKSLIMVFAALKLRREEGRLKNPIILIVTDRRKLDRQITKTFRNCDFPNPIQANNMSQLYSLLGASAGCTIMTTVHKFHQPLDRPLSEAENIIVMTDEAHRTQYGFFALNLRKALPNASFFAFTGTPLGKRDRNTYRHFSPPGERYLDSYNIRQSQADKATLPIKYESRLAKLQVVKNSIDNLLNELFLDKSERELTEIKRRYATPETILGAPRRIERIAMDIVSHYRRKIAPNNFKAQIVATNRKAAVAYKNALDNLVDPSWSTVIMTVTNDDPQEWKEKYRRTADEEDYISGNDVFQNPDNPLKFIIVCDKLLTGFDAPIEQVIYLDQRMREHTLLQAIARTNRPYPRKNYGLIVDYAGVGRELAEALAIFDQADLEGIFSLDDLRKELAALEEIRDQMMEIFKRVKRDRSPAEIIQQCLQILRPDDVRAEFERLFREFARGIDILMPDPCVEPFLDDFKFLGMIREAAKNLYRDERLSLENCSRKVEKLIHAHITEAGIWKILAPINITAPDFEEKLDLKISDRAKASHLEYAIRDTIEAKAAEDPHFYETLQDKLESIIEADRDRREEEAELLKDLLHLSKQEERREVIAGEKGLSGDEFAFYGLLEPHKDCLFPGDDEERCRVSKALVEEIQNKLVVDWSDKEDIKKEMRRSIKDILREKRFPAAKLDLFARELVDLAKARFKD